MKKLFALLLAVLMLMSLTACGGGEGGEKGGDKPAEPTIFDVGNFKVAVPDGWKAFAVKDVFGEDPNAVNPDQVQIGKGVESEYELLSKPYVQVVHTGPETTMMVPDKEFYDEAADIEPITAGGLTWNGFTATSLGYPIAVLWTTTADGHFLQINCFIGDTDAAFKVTDADFQQILGGITIN